MQQQQFTLIRGDAASHLPEASTSQHKLKLVPLEATGKLEAGYGGYQPLDSKGRIIQQATITEAPGQLLTIQPGWSLLKPLAAVRQVFANRAQEHFFRDLAAEVVRHADELRLIGISRSASSGLLRDSHSGFEYELDLSILRRYWKETGVDGIRNGLPYLVPKARELAERKAQDFFVTAPGAALLPRVGVLETPHVFCPVAPGEFSLARGASLGEGLFVELFLLRDEHLVVLDEAACFRIGAHSKNLGMQAANNARTWNRYLPPKMPTVQDPIWIFEGSGGVASVLFLNLMFDRRVRGDSNIVFALPSRDQLVITHMKSLIFDLVRGKVAQVFATSLRQVSPHFYQLEQGQLQKVD